MKPTQVTINEDGVYSIGASDRGERLEVLVDGVVVLMNTQLGGGANIRGMRVLRSGQVVSFLPPNPTGGFHCAWLALPPPDDLEDWERRSLNDA